MTFYIPWILWFAFALVIVSAIQFFLRKKKVKASVRFVLIVLKAVLGIAFAVLPLAGPVQFRPAQPLMIALYAVLLSDAFADLFYTVICLIKKAEHTFRIKKIISIVLGVLFFVYGTVNMQTVKPNYHSFSSRKLKSEHKIVFVSDIHIGSVQPFSVLEKEIADIKDENPECIILGGDITDDYTTLEEAEKIFRIFGKCGLPVYYIYGNHDRQKHAEYANGLQYTADELENILDKNGITVLKDEYVSLGDDLMLVGREDISEGENRADAEKLYDRNPDRSKYLIVADHQPFEFKENYTVSHDLQLSGHTHAGQLFPLKALYSVIGYAHGEFKYKESALVVSSGAGGWRVPFRTDSHCYYEVITLSAENA
jgi:predicted MPP superfamily phosphohydrolase